MARTTVIVSLLMVTGVGSAHAHEKGQLGLVIGYLAPLYF